MVELLKAKSEFRKKGITLIADKVKSGGGGSWKFAGEDNFIKTIQIPLTECGLEIFATMSFNDSLGTNVMKMTLYHVGSGEYIESSISMAQVVPKKDKNGNSLWLDAEMERGKQFGYWSRILGIRILGLSDVDPEDVNNRQVDLDARDKDLKLREVKLSELSELMSKTKDIEATKDWVFKTFKVESIEDMPMEHITTAILTFKSKQNANT